MGPFNLPGWIYFSFLGSCKGFFPFRFTQNGKWIHQRRVTFPKFHILSHLKFPNFQPPYCRSWITGCDKTPLRFFNLLMRLPVDNGKYGVSKSALFMIIIVMHTGFTDLWIIKSII